MTTTAPNAPDLLAELLAGLEANIAPAEEVATPQPAAAAVVPIADARTRKEARAQLADEALAISLGTLRVIKQAFDENGADFDDALRALPLVHRVLEHVDKMDVARDTAKVFAPLIFSIVVDDNVPQVPPPKRIKPLAPLVIDIGAGGAAHD